MGWFLSRRSDRSVLGTSGEAARQRYGTQRNQGGQSAWRPRSHGWTIHQGRSGSPATPRRASRSIRSRTVPSSRAPDEVAGDAEGAGGSGLGRVEGAPSDHPVGRPGSRRSAASRCSAPPPGYRAQAARRAAWRRMAPDTPRSSTGPTSVNVIGVPLAASTTSWVTRTCPGPACSAILAAMFTVRPK